MAAAKTTASTTAARALRRFKTSSTRCNPKAGRAGSVMATLSLRHHHHVAGLEIEIVFRRRGDDLVVVDGDALGGGAVLAEDDDAGAGGEVAEPAGQRDGVEHGGLALEIEPARLPDLAEHGHLEAVDLAHDHRDLGVRHVVHELL